MRDTTDMAREIAAQYIKAERFQTWTHDYMMERLMELVSVSAATERAACCDAIWKCDGMGLEDRFIAMDVIKARGNT